MRVQGCGSDSWVDGGNVNRDTKKWLGRRWGWNQVEMNRWLDMWGHWSTLASLRMSPCLQEPIRPWRCGNEQDSRPCLQEMDRVIIPIL